MIGAQGVEVLDALQDIGKVPQGVLGGLRGGIGGAGKRAEGGYIHEAALVPPADVQGAGRAAEHGHGGGDRVVGDMEAGGKVVGAALGQIAQQGPLLQAHQAGDDLVERAVAAYGHHQIVVAALPLRGLGGVSGSGGFVDGNEIAGLGTKRDHVKQRTAGFIASSPRVYYEKKLFLGHKVPPAPSVKFV